MVSGALLLVAGCSSGQVGQDASEQAEGSSSSATETVTVTASSPAAVPDALTSIDPSSLASQHHAGTYVWNYSTGGQYVGLCVSGGGAVTCTGVPGAEVPDLTEHFPGRAITTAGTVLAERDYSNHPDSGSGTTSSSSTTAASGQPSGYMGASGLVSGVLTASGALVTASVSPCDGRGILILDSYVESSGPQEGIAALLDRHPGAEFAMPGRCPSLRGSLDGARVYPIFTDHGHDTVAVCSDKAARVGNARLLTTTAEHIDPC